MTDILVPTEQEGTKAVVKTWLKKVGDAVRARRSGGRARDRQGRGRNRGDVGGVLSEILVEEGAEVEPGTVLGRIAAGSAVESTDKAMAQGAGIAAPKASAPRAASSSDQQLPPGIRRMLDEHGLDSPSTCPSAAHG